MNDTVKKCSNCNFKTPISEWKKKTDGSLYQLCPTCCEMFREIDRRRILERADDLEFWKEADSRRPSIIRNGIRVKCTECDKEVYPRSLKVHNKTCKGKPLV